MGFTEFCGLQREAEQLCDKYPDLRRDSIELKRYLENRKTRRGSLWLESLTTAYHGTFPSQCLK